MLSLPTLSSPTIPVLASLPNHQPHSSTNPSHHHNSSHHAHHQNVRPPPNPHHPLYALATDERLLALRKQNIRRFGAGWLRPHGVPKTLQGMEDERLEREEAEALRQREMAMEEARLAQEALEEGGMEGDDATHEGEEERDLDASVPDMDDDIGEYSSDEESQWTESEVDDEIEGLEGAEAEGEGDYGSPPRAAPAASAVRGFVTPNTSFAATNVRPQVRLPARTSEGPITPGSNMLQQGIVDLDDEVPEAGSYEHTDTELEDASTDDGWIVPISQNHPSGQAVARQSQLAGVNAYVATQTSQWERHGFQTPEGAGNVSFQESGNAPSAGAGSSLGDNGSFLGGSVFGSSPLAATQMGEGRVVSLGSARRNAAAGRRGGRGRGAGREN